LTHSPLGPRFGPLLVFAAGALASCKTHTTVAPMVPPTPVIAPASVAEQWQSLQANVFSLVAENRTSAADSALQRFTRDNARTPEGDRARWWRILMRAEPRISSGDIPAAVAQIDSLLADSIATEVRTEAVLTRRNLVGVDSLRRGEVRRRQQATQLASDRLDDLRVARDSMARLSAEIDRLRRRLRAP